MSQPSPLTTKPTPLPSWTLEELRLELLRLTCGSDQTMVLHLLDGLAEDMPSLTPREVLHELLAILVGVSETLEVRSTFPAQRSSQEGVPPMT